MACQHLWRSNSAEIGVRKVLGASVFNVLFLLISRVYKAYPDCHCTGNTHCLFATSKWLSGFLLYRIKCWLGCFSDGFH